MQTIFIFTHSLCKYIFHVLYFTCNMCIYNIFFVCTCKRNFHVSSSASISRTFFSSSLCTCTHMLHMFLPWYSIFTRMCTCIFIGIVFLALINQFILLYPVFAHVYIFWSSRGGNFAALSCAIFIINQFTVLVDHDVP